MADPKLQNLLKWSIENSTASLEDPTAPKDPKREIDPEVLRAVFAGMTGPSDGEMMMRKMAIVMDPEYSVEDRASAFDDFEMLVENLDNSNNLENMKLWPPLIDQLKNEEEALRLYAAWCIGTAVENNDKSQRHCFSHGAIPLLAKVATEDSSIDVRKKAIRALSCASRNFQESLDALVDSVPAQFKPEGKLDAADMDSVDSLINQLKAEAERLR